MYAYEEALVHWDAASRLLGTAGRTSEQAKLLQRAADVMYVSGVNFARATEYATEALSVAETSHDHHQQALSHFQLGRAYTTYQSMVDIPRAVAHLRQAVRLLGHEEASPLLAYVYCALAAAYDRCLQTSDGLQTAQIARRLGEALGHEGIRALAAAFEGIFTGKRGQLRTWRILHDEAIAIATLSNEATVRFYCLWDRAYLTGRYLADPRTAIALISEEIGRGRILEGTPQEDQLTHLMTVARFECGDLASIEPNRYEGMLARGAWQAALELSLSNVARFRQTGYRGSEAGCQLAAGMCLHWLGRLDEAAEALVSATRLFGGQDYVPELRTMLMLAVVESERADPRAAANLVSRCGRMMADGEDWRGLDGLYCLAVAATRASERDYAEAASAFQRATGLLSQRGLPWSEAEAYRLWGRALASADDQSGAIAKFRSAIKVYRRIGAGSPWIARVVREYARVPDGDADRTWS
jgi:tetratricopeptide (TPR) repeat protein